MKDKSILQELVERCFTKQELEFLLLQKDFVDAIQDLTTNEQAEKAIYLGARLMRGLAPQPRPSSKYDPKHQPRSRE